MTVLDTSGAVDFLLGNEAFEEVSVLLRTEGTVAVPDLLIFEVVAVFRRLAVRRSLDPDRARGAISDLGDLPMVVFPTLPLRLRAWELRDNMTAADGLFVGLAEFLDEPLATKDRGLVESARRHTGIEVIELAARPAPAQNKVGR